MRIWFEVLIIWFDQKMIWKSWGLGGRVLPLLVSFEAACCLCLVVASVLIAMVPLNVKIMNELFVSFEAA